MRELLEGPALGLLTVPVWHVRLPLLHGMGPGLGFYRPASLPAALPLAIMPQSYSTALFSSPPAERLPAATHGC